MPHLSEHLGEMLAGEELVMAIKNLLGPAVVIRVVSRVDPAITRSLQVRGEMNGSRRLEVVGIKCGILNDALVVAGFRTLKALESFLKDNPQIGTCPVTKWGTLLLLWLRTDFLAENVELEEICWFTNGIVPLCWAGEDEVIKIARSGIPTTVSYNDIVWPQAASGVFRYAFLKSVYGPFFTTTKRKKSLNLSLWAAWLGDRLRLRFDARIGSFRHTPKPGETGEILAVSTVKELVLAALQDSARLEPEHFPMAEIRPHRVEELIKLMEIMTALPSPISDVAGMEQFLQTGIIQNPKGDVTSEELWQAYQAHCQKCGCDRYTRHEFWNLIQGKIRMSFGRTISHNIMRGTARRGYCGISLAVEHIKPGQMPASPGKGLLPQFHGENPGQTLGKEVAAT